MMEPKAIVIGGYGVNADAELERAFALAGAKAERLHLADLVADPGRPPGVRIIHKPLDIHVFLATVEEELAAGLRHEARTG